MNTDNRNPRTWSAEAFIRVYLWSLLILAFVGVKRRLARSNVHFSDVSRTIDHRALTEVIGTGFICD
jgi:hypothetical protein